MSIGARPLDRRGVEAIFDRKVADFQRASRGLRLRQLGLDPYFEVAREDPDVRFAIDAGFITEVAEELRDPVIADLPERQVVTCPDLVLRVLANEPPEIHRAFVEGALFRKLFRFFVPATHEGGADWEATEQVRTIMQRHFAFQLVAVETVLGRAS